MRVKMFDGLKGWNIPVNWDSDFGWEVDGKQVGEYEFYSTVAAVHRAMNLNAGAVAEMPFALVTESGTDYDTSADWKNKGNIFGESPGSLFGLWRKSLAFTNKAYGMVEKGDKPLRYLVPTTIENKIDKRDGLVGFIRKINNQRIEYPLEGPIIHIFDMDWDVESEPSENTEYKALCAAAGIAYYADHYVGAFFQRGGIKPHLLQVKGVPQKEDREKIESWWDRLMSGVTRRNNKVVNADVMDAKPIGSGVDDFKENSFYKQALENIAMATGIPLSLLLANSANLATAKQEYKSWYDNEVITSCGVISRGFNQSFYARKLGLRLEFRTKETDPDQEEEQKKSYSFTNYAGVLMNNRHPAPLSMAARLVGIDMPEGFDYEDLDEQKEEEEKPQEQGEQEQRDDDRPPQLQPVFDPEEQGQEKTFTPNPEQLKELKNWMDIAERKHGRGEGAPTWDAVHIPVDVATAIDAKLKVAATLTDVQNAFDLTHTTTPAPVYADSELKYLADAINKLADSHTLTIQEPEKEEE